MRVYELATELDVKTSDVINAGKALNLNIGSHMQNLNDEQVAKIKTKLPVKVKMTKPWDNNANPFSMDMFRLKKKRKGFRCRFAVKDNIQRYQDQGWKIADIKDYGGTAEQLAGEEGKIDTAVRRRDLILMELPEELGQKRDEYIDRKTNTRTRQIMEQTKSAVESIEHGLGESVKFEQDLQSSGGTAPSKTVETLIFVFLNAPT